MQIQLENGENATLEFTIEGNEFYYVWAELKTIEGTFRDCSGAFITKQQAESFLLLCRREKVLPSNISAVYEDRLFIDILG